jgi:hypothetical protein
MWILMPPWSTSLRDTREGVVIGERKCRKADLGGLCNDQAGGVGPVGRRRVDVEVDRHRFS